jgi:hypothetical protein
MVDRSRKKYPDTHDGGGAGRIHGTRNNGASLRLRACADFLATLEFSPMLRHHLTLPMLNPQPLAKLQRAFRLSMRRLHADLCRELGTDHADLSRELKLPASLFDCLRSAFPPESYSTWKVVGWVESLNDLLYLLDVCRQLRVEQDRTGFAAQLFDECQENFFEHGYLDDLFPNGRSQARGLEKRVLSLCRRLGGELTQEALWFDPGLSVTWLRRQKMRRWNVSGDLQDHFERAELPGVIATGID